MRVESLPFAKRDSSTVALVAWQPASCCTSVKRQVCWSAHRRRSVGIRVANKWRLVASTSKGKGAGGGGMLCSIGEKLLVLDVATPCPQTHAITC